MHNWTGQLFAINRVTLNIEIGDYLYDTTFEARSWTSNEHDSKRIIVHIVSTESEAVRLKSILESIKNGSVADQYEQGSCNQNTILVESREITGREFDEWLQLPKPHSWEYNSVGNCIVAYLEVGIRMDFADFQKMVSLVVKSHPITAPATRPRAIELFTELCNFSLQPSKSIEQLRDKCFYIYNTPLLWEGYERCQFKAKVWYIRNINKKGFEKVPFNRLPIDMTDWQKRIPVDLNNHLYRVLIYPKSAILQPGIQFKKKRYNFPFGFVTFERNFGAHKQDYDNVANQVEIEGRLFDIFPESCSVVYYALIAGFPDFNTTFRGRDLRTILTSAPSHIC
ncbi:hypothetical protein RHGRI_027916 [Rhododendron griersonianum]|uniref:Uncharacterized protein n=1 Tax=Rhododendron griersonianum TaxID=479676 RepID=A0AAV6IYL8_9ERIC|nr:hypothetical protein RHGRI_027916 [Rhododendron griersonianum]